MKIHTTVDGVSYRTTRDASGMSATLHGLDACPRCGGAAPVRVQGRSQHVASHDTYEADGVAVCCGKPLGVITAKVNTLFGIDEDERVLHGRPRVY